MSRPRGRRLPYFLALPVGLLLLLAAVAYAYDHGRRDTIAHGVRVNGLDVGGMSAAAARTKIQSDLVAPLARPVVVHSGRHTWRLSGRRAGLTVDTDGLVADALRASRQGNVVSRTLRGLTGGSVSRDLPLRVTYHHWTVRALTAQVRATVQQAPRNATVKPAGGTLQRVPSRSGVSVDNRVLAFDVEHALTDGTASRNIVVPTHRLAAAVTTSNLAAKYPAYIVVDRGAFTLRYYDHLKLKRSYPIAVGMQGLETPPGLYDIQYKQVDPPWVVPNDSWAGALAGRTIPPGPQDPLKARFMAFDGGAGIHGIDPSEYSTIGHTASHGCVRMMIPDVIDLYGRVSVHTPVFIA